MARPWSWTLSARRCRGPCCRLCSDRLSTSAMCRGGRTPSWDTGVNVLCALHVARNPITALASRLAGDLRQHELADLHLERIVQVAYCTSRVAYFVVGVIIRVVPNRPWYWQYALYPSSVRPTVRMRAALFMAGLPRARAWARSRATSDNVVLVRSQLSLCAGRRYLRARVCAMASQTGRGHTDFSAPCTH